MSFQLPPPLPPNSSGNAQPDSNIPAPFVRAKIASYEATLVNRNPAALANRNLQSLAADVKFAPKSLEGHRITVKPAEKENSRPIDDSIVTKATSFNGIIIPPSGFSEGGFRDNVYHNFATSFIEKNGNLTQKKFTEVFSAIKGSINEGVANKNMDTEKIVKSMQEKFSKDPEFYSLVNAALSEALSNYTFEQGRMREEKPQ